ncbi:hypothetical protein D9758_015189 [Tetrapyrgos nigripes]|uniref:Uncharacterized protein n=1 Tax=Tetrapyrgos nigripes TaxID=182062 RepID=A0A8H5FDZ5_9AGAR|nr:hypothetical protein D9758_015189 [Tetrapyrgos nigripes]
MFNYRRKRPSNCVSAGPDSRQWNDSMAHTATNFGMSEYLYKALRSCRSSFSPSPPAFTHPFMPLESSLTQNIVSLPPYSDASPPPSYSSNPACGEQSIQLSPRSRTRPTGTWTKKSGSVSLLLMGQDDKASSPSYGRQGSVNGMITLDGRDAVSEVTVKLEGQMYLIIAQGGTETTQMFELSQTLWSSDSSVDITALCPSVIPFNFRFPSTFSVEGRPDIPLPPSIDLHYPGSSGMMVSTTYTLKVKVKARSPTMGFWTKVKRMSVPLDYFPRTRPPYSISNSDLFSDLKIAPEQWHQTVSVIKSRSRDDVPPIDCHLFIPSSKVYALSDTIPFHVNLTGALRSLREFLPSSSSSKDSSPVTVTLLRQTSVEINGERGWKNSTIGKGTVRGIPPPFSHLTCASREGSLDWEGEIQVSKSVLVGGFNAGSLCIKDFIVLSVKPSSSRSYLQSLELAVNVRLVTESAGIPDF